MIHRIRAIAKAQKTFASYAAMGAPELPVNDLSALQVRLCRWQNHNFGPTPLWRNVLGMSEELGEYFAAVVDADVHEQLDAIGDMGVFLAQACTSLRVDLGTLLHATPAASELKELLPIGIGQLAHAALKHEQKIRGFDDVDLFREQAADAAITILEGLEAVSNSLDVNFSGLLFEVAEKVLTRDWVKSPKVGA